MSDKLMFGTIRAADVETFDDRQLNHLHDFVSTVRQRRLDEAVVTALRTELALDEVVGRLADYGVVSATVVRFELMVTDGGHSWMPHVDGFDELGEQAEATDFDLSDATVQLLHRRAGTEPALLTISLASGVVSELALTEDV